VQQLNKNCIRIRVSVLLKSDDGRICFVRHCKDGRRYWLLPGGGQEPCESVYETAARELAEELQISAAAFRMLFIRESFNKDTGRHIQFMVFEGINPDFSTLNTGTDPRVEGFDFFGPEEIERVTIYPAMKADLLDYARGKTPELFRTLDWIS
jgi:ADP-ribose pyrophosphatase YjhB (NUDIX family)